MNRLTGRILNKEWHVGAQHALYREDGTWYHVLKKFPGALFDACGYILFQTQHDYETCPGISVALETNSMHAPNGINTLPGYRRVK
jgi:5-methylcytosine-specific restriction enzyme A